MGKNPHILVFKLKEIIYTGIFVVLGILLIVLFVNMFGSDNKKNPNASSGEISGQTDSPVNAEVQTVAEYSPGIYTASLMLNNSSMEIEVCVDADHINSVSIKNLDESVTTMYPLMANSINDISNQIVNSQSLENITYSEDCRYTYLILIDTIRSALSKAVITDTPAASSSLQNTHHLASSNLL